MNNQIVAYRRLVMMSDGEGYTTSRKIADRFNRSHFNVLQSIDRLNAAIKKSHKFEFKHEIFKDASYIDSRGRMRREFIELCQPTQEPGATDAGADRPGSRIALKAAFGSDLMLNCNMENPS